MHWSGFLPRHLRYWTPSSQGVVTNCSQSVPLFVSFCLFSEKMCSSALFRQWYVPSSTRNVLTNWLWGTTPSVWDVRLHTEWRNIGFQSAISFQKVAFLHHFKSFLLSHKGIPLHIWFSSTHDLVKNNWKILICPEKVSV